MGAGVHKGKVLPAIEAGQMDWYHTSILWPIGRLKRAVAMGTPNNKVFWVQIERYGAAAPLTLHVVSNPV